MRVPHTRGIRRLAAVALFTVVGLYVLNLSNLLVAEHRAETVEAVLATRVAAEELAIADLEAETDRARTDAFVESYIRDRRNWAQPGDRVVLPVPEAGDAAGPAPVGAEPPPPGIWERMRRMLGRGGASATPVPSAAPTSPVTPPSP
jgi:hypothetical protein